MDLQFLSSSISSLQSLKNLAQENAQLKNDLLRLQQTFETYKEKIQNSIKSNLSLHSQALLSKQAQIESLQMQNSELQLLLSKYSSHSTQTSKSQQARHEPVFSKLIQDSSTWSALKSYLNTNDLLKLINIQGLRPILFKDPDLYNHIENLMSTPDVQPAIIDPPQPPEQQDVNQLLDKYVKNQHIIGRMLEKKLTDAMPTIIRLFKSTGNAMPSQKFNSISELVQNIFPYDILLETFIKSGSAFSKTSASLNEWLSFLHNLLAGLITESSLAYIESAELTKLKNILVEKLRKAKDQLKVIEKENFIIKDELKRLKDVKDHLVSRLHLADLKVIEKMNENYKLGESIDKLNKNTAELEGYISLLQKSEAGRIEGLKAQVKTYQSQVSVLTQQREELVSAFNDFGFVFNSFNLKLS